MNLLEIIQLLGNLGEFIGSIAVLVTLLYLASQVKQTKRLLQASNALGRGAASREINGLIIQVPRLAELQAEVLSSQDSVPDRQQIFIDAIGCSAADAAILDVLRYISFRAMETGFFTEGESER